MAGNREGSKREVPTCRDMEVTKEVTKEGNERDTTVKKGGKKGETGNYQRDWERGKGRTNEGRSDKEKKKGKGAEPA